MTFFHRLPLLLVLTLPVLSSGSDDIIAEFGGLRLSAGQFKKYSLPDNPAQRRRTLKKLVDTRVYFIIINQLLSRSGIKPDLSTARRYIQFRKMQNRGTLPENFLADMERLASQTDFQLRCAIFFSFFAADATAVEPTAVELRDYYLTNMKKYRKPGKADFSIFKAGKDDITGRNIRDLIIARLRQGEAFDSLAQKYDPSGARDSISARSQTQLAAAMAGMQVGECKSVTTAEGIFIIKLISREAPKQLTAEESACYIRETLSTVKLKNALHRYITEILNKTPVRYHF